MQDTIGDQLERLRMIVPNRTKFGQLYRYKKETQARYSLVQMYVIMRSDEGDTRFHFSFFRKKPPGLSPAEWGAWMEKHFASIYEKNIVAYMNRTEETSWQVLEIIGWVGEQKARRNGKRKSKNSALAVRRNKTKRQGAKRGKTDLRRRHRNRRR